MYPPGLILTSTLEQGDISQSEPGIYRRYLKNKVKTFTVSAIEIKNKKKLYIVLKVKREILYYFPYFSTI